MGYAPMIFHRNTRLIKFLVAGGCAAATEYTTFLILYHITNGQHLFVSQSLSFLAGFIVSFILNKTWVFKSDGRAHEELTRYAILAAINLALSNIIIWGLTDKAHIIYWVSKVLVMAMVASWNYTLFQRLIFRSSSRLEKVE